MLKAYIGYLVGDARTAPQLGYAPLPSVSTSRPRQQLSKIGG